MLLAPAIRSIGGVTIFGDDTVWYRFYPIAQYPTVRLDENGKPVFLLVKYAFSDDERAQNPKLPPGGGYMNFDVQFSVSDQQMQPIKVELQAWVNDEWNRLRNGTPEERQRQGVAGAAGPP